MHSQETTPFPTDTLSDLVLQGNDGESVERLHIPSGAIVRHITGMEDYFDVPGRHAVEPAARVAEIAREYRSLETDFGVRSVGFAFALSGRSEITDLWIMSRTVDPSPEPNEAESERIRRFAGQALHQGLTSYWVDRRIHGTPRLQEIYRASNYTYSPEISEFVLTVINPYLSVPGEEAPEIEEEGLREELRGLREMALEIYTPDEYTAWHGRLMDSLAAASQTP